MSKALEYAPDEKKIIYRRELKRALMFRDLNQPKNKKPATN